MKRYKFEEKKHVHTLDDKPLVGTTTLIGKVMPPPLVWWGAGMALEQLGWTNPKLVKREEGVKIAGKARKFFFINNEDYYDWLQECYRNHDNFKKKAGSWGSDTHKDIEQAVEYAIKHNNGFLYAAYENEALERFATWGRGKKFLHSEVHIYSEELWIGGIIDLVYEEDGNVYLADVKTAKAIYASNFIQMGLYDVQQEENGYFKADGTKVSEGYDITGYTVVNIPRESDLIRHKTYRNTAKMKALGRNLADTHKTLKELELIVKAK